MKGLHSLRACVYALFLLQVIPVGASAEQIANNENVEFRRLALGHIASTEDLARLTRRKLLYFGPVRHIDFRPPNSLFGEATGVSQDAVSKMIGLPGDKLVAIWGSRDSSGRLAITAVDVDSQDIYVPGASQLVVVGKIASMDATTGVAQVGALKVDYSGALYDERAQALRIGSVAAFIGLEYSPSGNLFAQYAISVPDAELAVTKGQTGSDRLTNGQTGSDRLLKGQTGSDRLTNGQTGSDRLLKGQTGSDK